MLVVSAAHPPRSEPVIAPLLFRSAEMAPPGSEDPEDLSDMEEEDAQDEAASQLEQEGIYAEAQGTLDSPSSGATGSEDHRDQSVPASSDHHHLPPGERSLVDQLQRSAEEDISEPEEVGDSVPSANTPGDISMGDAPSDDDQTGSETGDDAGGETAESGNQAEEAAEDKSEDESESSDEEEDEAEFQASVTSEDEASTGPPEVCMFCKETEDDDPIEDLEAFLACASCDNHAHRQCARENSAKDDKDGGRWKCPTCVQRDIKAESPLEAAARARGTAPRLVRDLLPVSRGLQKPGSHSIFAQPLISDAEDGGRALRKRKSLTQEPPLTAGKRRRKTTSDRSNNNDNDNNNSSSSNNNNKTSVNNTAEESTTDPDRAVAHSTRRASQIQKAMPTARILQHRPFDKAPPHKFILAFRLDQEKIEKILSKPPRPGKRRDRRDRRDRRRPPRRPPPPKIPPPNFQPLVPKFPALPTQHLIFPSIWSERENEVNAKPYGGILSETEADTSRSLPQLKDREIFEIARKEAEEERRKTSAVAEAEINGDHAGATKPSRTVSGPPSKIKCIQFGKYVIDTFYAAPYPEEYSHESRLFICEFCLKYLPSEFVAYRHKLKCPAKHPPGDEIYRDGSVSIWEVDGRKKTEYCQCLCLMAKMFLGSKTLYYDVEPFLFYILTEYDEFGYHFVGYFSKEKRPASQNNVSCILVMPIHQRKGYATFLIDFSYLLTRIEGKDGSPEKPLSDMGLTAYRSYWDLTISRHLLDIGMEPFSTKALMARTGMTADDVIHSLERLYAFIRDPVTKTYAIRYDKKLYESVVHEYEVKKHRQLKPENLVWTPYIMGRNDQATLDGQPMPAMAPREEDVAMQDDRGEVEQEVKIREEPVDDQVSPRSKSKSSQIVSRRDSMQMDLLTKDSPLVNEHGHIAPGPPSTDALHVAMSNEMTLLDVPINGLVNGHVKKSEDGASHEPEGASSSLSGYALAYRTLAIPPTRFQIDPPIPPSMLRNRSTKKRSHGSTVRPQNTTGSGSPTMAVPVRSSPRKAASVNGSVNGIGVRGSRAVSAEKVDTPVRRSGRKSGLAIAEVPSIDGTDEEKQTESMDHQEDTIVEDTETKVDGNVGEDEEEESSESSEEDVSVAEGESEEEVEEEDEEDDDNDDEDVSIPEVESEDEEEDEEEEEDNDDDDDDDADPEVEAPDDDDDEDEDEEEEEEDEEEEEEDEDEDDE